MDTYVALLRGINVVGRNVLPMQELKRVFERSDCLDVRTYIQSGNVVFRCAKTDAARLEKRLEAAVSKGRGFEPRVLVLARADLERAAAKNPFPAATAEPKSLHLFFLDGRPEKPVLEACESVRAGREAFALKDRVFYLHTPDGFGDSKLAKRAERLLGVGATARNWRTVTTLLAMAGE